MTRPRFGTEEDDVTRKCGARQSREGSEVRRRRVERTSKFVVLQQGLMVWASASTSQLMSVSFLRTRDGNKQCCSRGFHGWTTLKRLVLMMCVVTRTNFWLRTVRVRADRTLCSLPSRQCLELLAHHSGIIFGSCVSTGVVEFGTLCGRIGVHECSPCP